MESMPEALYRIHAGEQQRVIAGGMESMSQIPLQYPYEYGTWLEGLMRAKTPLAKLGAFQSFKAAYLKPRIALAEGLTDLVCGLNMGQTAEVLAQLLARGERTDVALQGERILRLAPDAELLREEIVPV